MPSWTSSKTGGKTEITATPVSCPVHSVWFASAEGLWVCHVTSPNLRVLPCKMRL